MCSGVQAEVISCGRNCFAAGIELRHLKFACVYHDVCNCICFTRNVIGFYVRT